MQASLRNRLVGAQKRERLPTVLAYNRIDGPGSSLDLREFQQALWSLPSMPKACDQEPAAKWTYQLPRTIGITIDVGTKIEAQPFEEGFIAVQSIEYATEAIARTGEVHPTRENWLLKILDTFRLSGVKFVLHNLRAGVQSSGLGGSAAATTGVCILANELAGRPFDEIQLVSIASRMEQDLGVSFTGTQEQSNVVFGGVVDYVWFPWGIPCEPRTGYGESLRFELLPPQAYHELEQRIAIFHTGRTRASVDVNAVWMKALSSRQGFLLHREKLQIAYSFREALRLRRWSDAIGAIAEYREVRTRLCSAYMDGAMEILGFAKDRHCEAFPLGAGGGGGILIFAPEPDALTSLKANLSPAYREIPFRIMAKGHELANMPMEGR